MSFFANSDNCASFLLKIGEFFAEMLWRASLPPPPSGHVWRHARVEYRFE
jgi:hypothetical protein